LGTPVYSVYNQLVKANSVRALLGALKF